MSQMLLSINPEHVENILSGSKKFEFRKVRCRENIDTIIIYSTFPIMKVVAEVQVVEILEGLPGEIWNRTSQFSGISKVFFDKYFDGKDKAVAYSLGEIVEYENPKSLSDLGVNCAPQSFIYLWHS